ncbi:MAG TPA: inositol 2-dehydrogenase [Casimicrobiaceae bacterium]|nr:inositol 2-dehydrogenase [Casimicrobiaceae bacterium]
MIEVALFGAGRIGKIHAGNIARLRGQARLKYVIDVDRDAAVAMAAKYRAEVRSVDAALGDESIRAVVIASSTDTHAELIQKAAAAGKAIFCEKPVDLDVVRARACAHAVGRAGVPCLIGFQRRYDPTFVALKKRLDAGEVGNAEMLIITSRDPGAPPIDYIGRSGGIFKDMLIHDFDVFRWILNDEAASIYATGSCLVDAAIGGAGDVDSTAVTIRTRHQRLVQISTSRRAAYGYDQRFEVLGSKGMLQAGNLKPTEVFAHTADAISQDKPEAFFLERYRVAYAAEMEHFLDAIDKDTPLRATINDGVKALELADAAMRSWREKRVIEL